MIFWNIFLIFARICLFMQFSPLETSLSPFTFICVLCQVINNHQLCSKWQLSQTLWIHLNSKTEKFFFFNRCVKLNVVCRMWTYLEDIKQAAFVWIRGLQHGVYGNLKAPFHYTSHHWYKKLQTDRTGIREKKKCVKKYIYMLNLVMLLWYLQWINRQGNI